MAKAIDKNTKIEDKIRELQNKRKALGFTSNKFGRVVMVNKEIYDNMLRNNDTLRDKNGLNDNFANLSESEIKTIRDLAKSKVKAPDNVSPEQKKTIEDELNKKRQKLEEKANKIIAEKVSTLRNFMDKYSSGVIEDENTGLSEKVLSMLDTKETKEDSQVDEKAIAEKDAEIERLKKELEESKKTSSKTVKTADNTKKTAKTEDKTKSDEDDPFKD